jgi:hypothetical protein
MLIIVRSNVPTLAVLGANLVAKLGAGFSRHLPLVQVDELAWKEISYPWGPSGFSCAISASIRCLTSELAAKAVGMSIGKYSQVVFASTVGACGVVQEYASRFIIHRIGMPNWVASLEANSGLYSGLMGYRYVTVETPACARRAMHFKHGWCVVYTCQPLTLWRAFSKAFSSA